VNSEFGDLKYVLILKKKTNILFVKIRLVFIIYAIIGRALINNN